MKIVDTSLGLRYHFAGAGTKAWSQAFTAERFSGSKRTAPSSDLQEGEKPDERDKPDKPDKPQRVASLVSLVSCALRFRDTDFSDGDLSHSSC